MNRTGALLLIALLTLASCTGSKSLAKKGAKLDAAGMYVEAAALYEQSAQRNQKNVDAKIGLKKTGQQLLNDKLSAFFKAAAMGSSKGEAVEAYLESKGYQERIGRLGVVLDTPDHYKADFERLKSEYLIERYNEGQALMAKEEYKAAEVVFARIARLEPNYKDASSLQSIAFLEPLYRNGKADLWPAPTARRTAHWVVFLVEDRRPARARGMAAAPVGAAVAVWLGLYVALGCGASSSAYYVDPVRSPSAFLRVAVVRLPSLAAAQLFFPPAEVASMQPAPRPRPLSSGWGRSSSSRPLLPLVRASACDRALHRVRALPGAGLRH